jgi:hypothetical protein
MKTPKKTKAKTQATPTGYEIPVPQRSDVLGALRKAAQSQKPEPKAQSEP